METKISKLYLYDIKKIKDKFYSDFSSTWDLELFKTELKNKNSKYIAYKKDGILLGFAGILKQYDEGHIMTINVDKNYRKHGIGSILLEKLILIAKKEDLKVVTLEVRSSNYEAQKLYKKYSFEVVRDKKKLLPSCSEIQTI